MSGFCVCQSPNATFSRLHEATVVRLKSSPVRSYCRPSVTWYILHMVIIFKQKIR